VRALPFGVELSPDKVLPAGIEEVFKPVSEDVTWLFTLWELYLQLYGTTDEHYEVMNSSAQHFFAILQTVVFEQLIVTIGRLTDPAETFGKPNASIAGLTERISNEGYPNLASELRERLDNFLKKYPSFRVWRNKRVDHTDLKTVTHPSDDVMPGLPRSQVQAAVDELERIVSQITETLIDTSQRYKPFLVAHGDGNALLEVLRKGLVS
jgi:hypothetical protein